MNTYKNFKNQLLKDEEIKKNYNELDSEFKLIQLIIKKRMEKGFTQSELAKRMGTKQSAISRLEKGTYNPTIAFMKKLAKALEVKLNISFS